MFWDGPFLSPFVPGLSLPTPMDNNGAPIATTAPHTELPAGWLIRSSAPLVPSLYVVSQPKGSLLILGPLVPSRPALQTVIYTSHKSGRRPFSCPSFPLVFWQIDWECQRFRSSSSTGAEEHIIEKLQVIWAIELKNYIWPHLGLGATLKNVSNGSME